VLIRVEPVGLTGKISGKVAEVDLQLLTLKLLIARFVKSNQIKLIAELGMFGAGRSREPDSGISFAKISHETFLGKSFGPFLFHILGSGLTDRHGFAILGGIGERGHGEDVVCWLK